MTRTGRVARWSWRIVGLGLRDANRVVERVAQL
jgi:hypothetical protein